ncbi:MAG: hypothetical protein QM802_07320 [Agriterribacter sp.]
MQKIHSKTSVKSITMLVIISIIALSCSKENQKPDSGSAGTGVHQVDSRLVGTWIWTSAGDANWYDESGVYTGPSYGLALEYEIHADGSGSSLSHFVSTIGAGSSMEVNINSTGFFESDADAHLGYFPLTGNYHSTSGESRVLNADEIYNPQSGKGKSFLYQKLEFKSINGRDCFEVTSSEGITDRYYKL